MKKRLLILLCFLLCGVMLISCGAKKEPDGDDTDTDDREEIVAFFGNDVADQLWNDYIVTGEKKVNKIDCIQINIDMFFSSTAPANGGNLMVESQITEAEKIAAQLLTVKEQASSLSQPIDSSGDPIFLEYQLTIPTDGTRQIQFLMGHIQEENATEDYVISFSVVEKENGAEASTKVLANKAFSLEKEAFQSVLQTLKGF